MWTLFAGFFLGLGGPAGRCDDSYARLPPAVSVLLKEAETIELISLDPRERPAKPDDSFQGWKVLGRATVREEARRREIIASVERGIAGAEKVSGCFEPRHGLRATRADRAVDLVICFSCGWIEVHSEAKTWSVWTSDSPKSAMNKALGDAGVRLAQDVEGP